MASSIVLSDNGVTSGSAGIKSTGGNDGVLLLQTTTSGGTATTAVTVDNAQNVGVGVTPSAWGTFTVAQVKNAAVMGLNTEAHFSGNMYYNAGYKYISNGFAARYSMNDVAGGAHAWFTAASGTAGNAITFTQAMTLDASGKLGIGVTSPDSRLHVVDPANAGLRIGYNSTSVNYYDADTQIFRNGASTERVRIAANGSFGVGPFDADVINSRTSAAAGNTRSLYTGWYNSTTPTNGTLSFNVTSNGNVTNTNNSYGPISDIKLKENIVDATPKLDDLMKVRIVNYNLKADLGYENHKQIGVIAQELEQVFAGLVDESPDKDEEGNALGTTTKSVKMTVFIPMLIKALQEQQSLIQSLTDRLTALEGAAK